MAGTAGVADADEGLFGRDPAVGTGTAPQAGTTYELALRQGGSDPRLARQVRRLAAAVTGEFPPEVGGIMLLGGVAAGGHVADVAGLLACALGEQYEQEVLLVDADGAQKILSQRFAATAEAGLAAAVHCDVVPRHTLVSSILPRLRFLPYGHSAIPRRVLERQTLQCVLTDLKRDFRYIVVAGGTTVDPLLKALGRCCEGTYLVIPLGQAERDRSAAVIQRLTACGARLLGAIVTGVT
jgi:Mrp family chromosome partitioning ATPase